MNQRKITSSKGSLQTNGWRLWTPRLLAGAVGLILISAALFKSTDMELFIRQIRDYGIISHNVFLVLGAWGLIMVECVLGTALLTSYRPKLTISIAVFLLLIFIGANVWAWFTGVTQDCGCFGGWLKRTPGEALIEDLVLLAALFLAWLGQRHSQTPLSHARSLAVLIACLIGVLLPLIFGFPASRVFQPYSGTIDMNLGQFEIHGIDNINLNRGAYLIVIMETDCSHCQDAIPKLNQLAEAKELPEVIALCTNEEYEIMRFKEEYQPSFSIGKIKEDLAVYVGGTEKTKIRVPLIEYIAIDPNKGIGRSFELV